MNHVSMQHNIGGRNRIRFLIKQRHGGNTVKEWLSAWVLYSHRHGFTLPRSLAPSSKANLLASANPSFFIFRRGVTIIATLYVLWELKEFMSGEDSAVPAYRKSTINDIYCYYHE